MLHLLTSPFPILLLCFAKDTFIEINKKIAKKIKKMKKKIRRNSGY